MRPLNIHIYAVNKYFVPSDYVTSPNDRKPRLRLEAIPSIFNFPERLKKPQKQPRKLPTWRKSLIKRKYESEPTIDATPPPNKKPKQIISPIKSKLRYKIKTLKQKLWQIDSKIKSLNDIVNTLKKEEFIVRGLCSYNWN